MQGLQILRAVQVAQSLQNLRAVQFLRPAMARRSAEAACEREFGGQACRWQAGALRGRGGAWTPRALVQEAAAPVRHEVQGRALEAEVQDASVEAVRVPGSAPQPAQDRPAGDFPRLGVQADAEGVGEDSCINSM